MGLTRRRLLATFYLLSVTWFTITIVNLNIYVSRERINRDLAQNGQEFDCSNFKNYSFELQDKERNNLTINDNTTVSTNKDNSNEQHVVEIKKNSAGHKDLKNRNVERPFNLDDFIPLEHDLDAIRTYTTQANKDQHIRNLEKFDLSSSSEAVAIVIQVHNRTNYLRSLIDSFENAAGIEQTLLIFSHDVFDDEVNRLIFSITFCPVMQIFYPLSIQLFPSEFPGEDPKDCSRDTNKTEAIKLNCTNSHWPDKYGHYRDAKMTQIKHHWFWKINHVFDHLYVTKNLKGPILFVEEDHYVTPDFLPVLHKMYILGERVCKDCSIFTIGTYKNPKYGVNALKVEITMWHSARHNMGMAMTRYVWEKIKACTQVFCTYDDYNWDWSLQHISNTCFPNQIRCMLTKSPRIFHIGSCGVHSKNQSCDVFLTNVQNIIKNNANSLFPDFLDVQSFSNTPVKPPKPHGGYADYRDQQLCKDFNTPQYH